MTASLHSLHAISRSTETANELPHIVAQTVAYPFGLFFDVPVLHVGLMFVLVAFNGFFVAMEVALIKLRENQLGNVKVGDSEKIRLARRILDNLPLYITACKFGSSAAGVLLGAISVPFLLSFFIPLLTRFSSLKEPMAGYLAFILATGIVLSILVVWGKVIPNSIGFRREVAVTLGFSRWLHAFFIAFMWLVIPMNRFSNWFLESILNIKPASDREIQHSVEDLRSIVEGSGEEAVTDTEKEILINTLELSELRVYNIVTPRSEVVALDINALFHENLQKAVASNLTRFPVIDEHLDETLGWVHIRDLMGIMKHPKPNLAAVAREILLVEEDMELDHLLTTFLSRKSHIALVIDHYGGANGIVVLDDLLEILVGESLVEGYADDQAEEELVEKISEDEFFVDASLPLHELDDIVPELHIDLESCDSSTVGGFVTSVIGHLPKIGESTQIDGFRVEVTQADERKILEVKFERIIERDLDSRQEDVETASPVIQENDELKAPEKRSTDGFKKIRAAAS